MIGICAPYTRSETTLAASMVATVLRTSGAPVRWFLEGEQAPEVELGWEAHLARNNSKGRELAERVNCWIYFAVHSAWPTHARKMPMTTRHLVFRDWRQHSARWAGPKPTRYIAAEEAQPSFRQAQKQKHDFVRWGAGVAPTQRVAPRANKALTALVLVDRMSCCTDIPDMLKAFNRWTADGHHVVLCSWSTASHLACKHWQELMGRNQKFEWHRKPTFKQLKFLALDSDCCILPQRSTAYGAWVAFFRSLGVWTIGNSMRVVNGSLDEAVTAKAKVGSKITESRIWTAEPYRATATNRLAALQRTLQAEAHFAEYWNNVWTRPALSSPE